MGVIFCAPMAARILDGKSLAAQVRAGVKARVSRLAQRGMTPGLAVILAGDDPASKVYVRNKVRACEETGVRSSLFEYPSTASEKELLESVARLNADPAVHGILVQLPLPKHIDARRVLDAVSPAKDVDGFHDANLGALLAGKPKLVPCTPAGVMRLLEHAGVALSGRRAVVIGRSNIVGKPLAQLLLQENATVTIAHSRTKDLAGMSRRADILCVAIGKPEFVRGDWIKPGATVIDVGINRVPGKEGKTKLVGDVAYEEALKVAGAITPVPGGVGPMTIACLLVNTLRAACARAGIEAPRI